SSVSVVCSTPNASKVADHYCAMVSGMLNLDEIEMGFHVADRLASFARGSSRCANTDSNLGYAGARRLVSEAGDEQKIRKG
ncbi:MAG: hypothetical protein WA653_01845, partial [Candidatus Sulfotelmatobacter sp.]